MGSAAFTFSSDACMEDMLIVEEGGDDDIDDLGSLPDVDVDGPSAGVDMRLCCKIERKDVKHI